MPGKLRRRPCYKCFSAEPGVLPSRDGRLGSGSTIHQGRPKWVAARAKRPPLSKRRRGTRGLFRSTRLTSYGVSRSHFSWLAFAAQAAYFPEEFLVKPQSKNSLVAQ